MDGNSRWANSKGFPKIAGHKQGAETAKETAKIAIELGVKYLTLYTFSSENWKRPAEEVSGIISLLKYYLERDAIELIKNGVNLRFIGDLTPFPKDVSDMCARVSKQSKNNDRLFLNIALNYGSKQEIITTVKSLITQGKEINIENIEQNLFTHPHPDVDLLIRTGGDHRLSNFLLWQMAYTELYFTQTLWPDFDKTTMQKAIEDFKKRERRFGGRIEL